MALHVHHTLWFISSPTSTKQQREMPKFKVLWRTSAHDGEFFILPFSFKAVLKKLVPASVVRPRCTSETNRNNRKIVTKE